MDTGSSSTQPVPSRRGRQRRSSDITIPHINNTTYQENRRIRRARTNGAPNLNNVAIKQQPARALVHAQPTSADPYNGKMEILVPSLSYELFLF
jgi:hypothetical protein